MDITLILGLVLIGVVVYLVSVYNRLQTLRTQIKASIQEIGNQLKRQMSLIPNLENSVRAYMGHEKGIFAMLSDARKAIGAAAESGSMKDMDSAADKIQSLIPRIQVIQESNPELKADQTVSKFMDELSDTADKLMYSRRTLIDLSQDFNQMIMTFPNNIVAGLFGFKEEKGLDTPMSGAHMEVSEEETKDVKVSL